MAKKLVIVESPAKAKTIGRYLGSGYDVEATMGHIRDLPTKEIGIDIEHDFAPSYEVLAGRKKIVSALKKKAAAAETIYLAPDLDREGEAIAWHVKEALKVPDEKALRVTFNEITKGAIEKAFESPGKIAGDKVNAQQARRLLDRLVGYQISPILWRKIPRVGTDGKRVGLSAGRVQSVAVRLIVDREREIEAFESEEYWRIIALLAAGDAQFKAELEMKDGAKLEVRDEAGAKAVLAGLENARYVVSSLDTKDTKSNPAAPFTTSTLQQAASTVLRFTAKKTMMLAQQLYEGVDVGEDGPVALITYMRTDSVRISADAVKAAREHVAERFGRDYLPDKPRVYRSKGKAQEAHEAVRPTYIERTPESLKGRLSPDLHKLYSLIWRRTLASQMAAAVYKVTNAGIAAGPYTFVAKGRIVAFPGHTILANGDSEGEDMLPALVEGQELRLVSIDPSQRFTQPPPRYTEAALVKTLEKEGIGRPSTYATIISTIQDRGYARQEARLFHPTPLGVFVTDKLVKHFPKVLDIKFTARMEEELDQVEAGDLDWLAVMREFYGPFEEDLKKAAQDMTPFEETDEPCPQCGRKLMKRLSKSGIFLGCSGYPDCGYTRNLSVTGGSVEADVEGKACPVCAKPLTVRSGPRGPFVGCSGYPDCTYTAKVENPEGGAAPADDEAAARQNAPERICPDCGKPLVVRTGRRGPFYGCTGYPKCRHTEPLPESAEAGAEAGSAGAAGEGAAEAAQTEPAIDKKCPNCGKTLVKKMSRRGPFLGCPGYPECKHAEPLSGAAREARTPPEKTGRQCPECGKELVKRKGARGMFIGCSGYPRCRHTEDV